MESGGQEQGSFAQQLDNASMDWNRKMILIGSQAIFHNIGFALKKNDQTNKPGL